MLLDTLAPWQQEFPHMYLWWEDKMLRNPFFYSHTLFHMHVIHYFKISNLFRLQAVIAVYKLHLLLNILKKGTSESRLRYVALPYCSRNLFSPPFQFSYRSRKELPGENITELALPTHSPGHPEQKTWICSGSEGGARRTVKLVISQVFLSS